MKLSSWVPGQYLVPGQNDNGGLGRQQSELKGLGNLAMFLSIGLPLIIGLLVVSCCCCCFWRKTPIAKRRKARKFAAAEAAAMSGPPVVAKDLAPGISIEMMVPATRA